MRQLLKGINNYGRMKVIEEIKAGLLKQTKFVARKADASKSVLSHINSDLEWQDTPHNQQLQVYNKFVPISMQWNYKTRHNANNV